VGLSSISNELELALAGVFPEKEPPPVCVVRLSTGTWRDKRGLHQRKSLTFIKRLSSGYQVLSEDAGMIGAEFVLSKIINFDSCKDGLYRVVTVNESRD